MIVMYSTSLHPDVCMPNRNVYIGAPRNLSKDATEVSFIIKKKNGKSWGQPKWCQQLDV